MQAQHAVAWLDHGEAKVFLFNHETAESVRLATTLAYRQTHNKAGTVDGKRAPENDCLLPRGRQCPAAGEGMADRGARIGKG